MVRLMWFILNGGASQHPTQRQDSSVRKLKWGGDGESDWVVEEMTVPETRAQGGCGCVAT